jgi:hypothetical protein
MSSASKTAFSPGGAGSSKYYNVNVNLNTAGGNKKQGIAPTVGKDHWADSAIQIRADGTAATRALIISMNQLGGVGRGYSQFYSPNIANPRGPKRFESYVFNMNTLHK